MKKLFVFLVYVTSVWAGWHVSETITKDAYSFGQRMVVKDRIMIVGAPRENEGEGAIYIYEKNDQNNSWQMIQKIDMPSFTRTITLNGGMTITSHYEFKRFGQSVAITPFVGMDMKSHMIVVGAPDTNVSTLSVESYYDAVLVFDYNRTSSRYELSKFFLEKDNSGAGESVAAANVLEVENCFPLELAKLKQKIIVTGLPKENMVKIYRLDIADNTWSEENISAPVTGSGFGESVGMYRFTSGCYHDANPLVVGAPEENITIGGTNYQKRGAAYVYTMDGDYTDGYHWSGPQKLKQLQSISAVTYLDRTRFGNTVAVNNFRIIVGADSQSYTKNTETPTGEAIAYRYNTGELVPEWDRLGEPLHVPYANADVRAVAIKEDRVVLGTPELSLSACYSDGGAFIYEYANGAWEKRGALVKKETNDGIGYAVQISDYDKDVYVSTRGIRSSDNKIYRMKKHLDFGPSLMMYLLQ